MSDHPGITLFAMTAKSLAVVDALAAAAPGLLREVIGADDPGVSDGSYEALARKCVALGIPFRDRAQARHEPAGSHLLAVGWRWMISPGRATLVVFHDSLIPRYRGFNPLVTALIEGDAETGVTAMLGAEEYDRGDILAQVRIPLPRPIRIADAIGLVAQACGTLAADLGARIAAGAPLDGVAQDEAAATYSLWRDEEDYRLDWSQDAERIRNTILAVGPPYAGARSMLDGRPVRILDATVEPDLHIPNRAPGKVIFLRAGRPTVVCGTGLLRLDDLRDESSGQNIMALPRFRVRFT